MKPSWSIFDCRQLISFRLPLTDGDELRAASLRKAFYAELTLKSVRARRIRRDGGAA
jgi:hypothetical protein